MARTIAVVLVMALTACGGGADEPAVPEGMGLPDEDVRTILSIDRSFQDAMLNGDWQVLHGLYADDAVLMPPDHETVRGVDAIIEYYSTANPAEGIAGFNTDTDVIHGDATIGYHRGAWSMGSGEGAVTGSYLWVMRRTPDGEWRIVAEMFNRDG
jgi:ketosteroid isomerase-like protein